MDPVIGHVVAIAFALLFATAAASKLGALPRFCAILADYALIPPGLIRPVGLALAAAEVALALLWLAPTWRPLASLSSVALLTVYALAMAVNLIRNRRHISCGCGGSGQALSWALVARNAVYASAAISGFVTNSARETGPVDGMLIVVAVVVVVVLDRSVDTLIGNHAEMAAWRR